MNLRNTIAIQSKEQIMRTKALIQFQLMKRQR